MSFPMNRFINQNIGYAAFRAAEVRRKVPIDAHCTFLNFLQGIRDMPDVFNRSFAYENASGYFCYCPAGFAGTNCGKFYVMFYVASSAMKLRN